MFGGICFERSAVFLGMVAIAAAAPVIPAGAQSDSTAERLALNHEISWRELLAPAGDALRRMAPGDLQVAQAGGQRTGEAAAGAQAGGETRPDVATIPERGGVLTPPGTLVVEPSIEFQNDNVSRFVAGGVQVIDTVVLGVIEATEVERNVITSSLTARYGVTDRFELEFKAPFVYRDEEQTNTVVEQDSETTTSSDISQGDLGDIEFAGHYQLTSGAGFLPVTVANLRVKSTTGEGPFEVSRNAQGVETNPTTGSGFWAIEPSLTALIPSDPVVFYGNVGYLFNVKRDVDQTFGTQQGDGNQRRIGEVDPGDTVRMGFGMAFGLNQRTSLSLGYQHDFIRETETEVNDQTQTSESLQVGSLTIGTNYQASQRTAINVNVQAGVTEEAPDVRLLIRVPIQFQLY